MMPSKDIGYCLSNRSKSASLPFAASLLKAALLLVWAGGWRLGGGMTQELATDKRALIDCDCDAPYTRRSLFPSWKIDSSILKMQASIPDRLIYEPGGSSAMALIDLHHIHASIHSTATHTPHSTQMSLLRLVARRGAAMGMVRQLLRPASTAGASAGVVGRQQAGARLQQLLLRPLSSTAAAPNKGKGKVCACRGFTPLLLMSINRSQLF